MQYKWVALFVTTIGGFMSALDQSKIVTGLPPVLRDLDASLSEGVWIITGYRLIVTALLVAVGRASDIHGRVRFYTLGFTIFTIGSALSGAAPNASFLILARLIQGLGGALVMVNAISIVVDIFPPEELGLAISINFVSWSVASALGYPLTGVLLDLFGWRSLFLINIPVGLVGVLLAQRLLREGVKVKTTERFDYLGATLFTASLTLSLIAISVGDLREVQNLTLLAVGLTLLLAFALVERRQKHPMLDSHLLKVTPFAMGNVASLLYYTAVNSVSFMMAIYLQVIRNLTPLTTGLILTPMSIANIVVAPISGKLYDKHGPLRLTLTGLAVGGASLFWFSTLTSETAFITLGVGMAILGVGLGLFGSPNASHVMSSVPVDKRGVANGLRTTVNNLGGTISTPFAFLLMTLGIPYEGLTRISSTAKTSSANEMGQLLDGMRIAYLVLGVIAVLSIMPSFIGTARRQKRGEKREKSHS